MIYVVVIYSILTLIVGYSTRKRSKNAQAFHGTNMGILMCAVAGAGEWMGGTSTTGVAEYGYLWGVSGSWYTIANGIGILICALFFAKLYRSLNTPTIPGIIGHYFGANARMVSSAILIFIMVVVGISQMIAIGTLGNTLLGMDMSVSILILGMIVIIYTLFGGMLAVSYTNTLHLIVMYGGIVIAILVTLPMVGGMAGLTKQLPESYFNMATIGIPKVSSWILASVLGACTAQAGIQPILAAKDETTAVKSSLLIALLVAPFGILTAALGMITKAIYPDILNAKLALPILMSSLPSVIAGIVIAAILAAILSTASPIFLSCGTLFTKDIYCHMKPDTNDDKELLVSRIVTAMAGGICLAAAIIMYNFSAILDIVYFAYSMRGSLFIILLFGIYSVKAKISEKAVIASMIITILVGLFWIIYKVKMGSYPFLPHFSETYASVLAAVLSMGSAKIWKIFKRHKR